MKESDFRFKCLFYSRNGALSKAVIQALRAVLTKALSAGWARMLRVPGNAEDAVDGGACTHPPRDSRCQGNAWLTRRPASAVWVRAPSLCLCCPRGSAAPGEGPDDCHPRDSLPTVASRGQKRWKGGFSTHLPFSRKESLSQRSARGSFFF